MKNLREEIEKILKETSCKDMYSGLGAKSFLSLFRQTMLEVIGELEKEESDYSIARNVLKLEQRTRIHKQIGKE